MAPIKYEQTTEDEGGCLNLEWLAEGPPIRLPLSGRQAGA